jgi:hypothetical protein
MKIISGIFFAVIFGLVGARFAGPAVDWLIGTQVFDSPDQVAKFDLFARLGVTVAIALIGLFVGLIVAAGLRRRLIRSES